MLQDLFSSVALYSRPSAQTRRKRICRTFRVDMSLQLCSTTRPAASLSWRPDQNVWKPPQNGSLACRSSHALASMSDSGQLGAARRNHDTGMENDISCHTTATNEGVMCNGTSLSYTCPNHCRSSILTSRRQVLRVVLRVWEAHPNAQNLNPIPNAYAFATFPTFVKRLNNVFGKRSLLEVYHVLLHMLPEKSAQDAQPWMHVGNIPSYYSRL